MLFIGCISEQKPLKITTAKSNEPPIISEVPKEDNINTPEIKEEVKSICPGGMIEVDGEYCPEVQEICLKWIDDLRCAEFKSPTICLSKQRTHLHFCMDKFEWPNVEGSFPEVGITGNNAAQQCINVGKKLCSEKEFNFACEGEDMLPYTYGYVRDPKICNIDKPWRDYSKVPRKDWDQLYQAEKSDSNSQCSSWAGIKNLNGNVDEWVKSDIGYGYPIVSSGGYWSTVRDRCRPKTRAHDPAIFSFYQLGFRCCSDIK